MAALLPLVLPIGRYFGATVSIDVVFNLISASYGLMAIPTGAIYLAPKVVAASRLFRIPTLKPKAAASYPHPIADIATFYARDACVICACSARCA